MEKPSAPLVSVVIATRNRPELLRRAIGSVQANDLAGRTPSVSRADDLVETIVVFDQSDPDPTLVSNDPRRPIRVLPNVRTPGLAGARNTGVLAASGRWVAFLDDDDEWLPNKLAGQLTRLAARPTSRFATCGVTIRYEDRDHVRIPDETRLTYRGFLADRMTEVHPSSFLIARDLLLGDLGLVDEDLPGSYAEDYDLLLRAVRLGPITVAPETLVRVWWHRATYFRDRWEMIDDALEYLVAKYPDFADEPEGLARIRGQQAFARAAAGRGGVGEAIRTTLRLKPTEPRAAIAFAVRAGLSPDLVLAVLHRFGRGI